MVFTTVMSAFEAAIWNRMIWVLIAKTLNTQKRKGRRDREQILQKVKQINTLNWHLLCMLATSVCHFCVKMITSEHLQCNIWQYQLFKLHELYVTRLIYALCSFIYYDLYGTTLCSLLSLEHNHNHQHHKWWLAIESLGFCICCVKIFAFNCTYIINYLALSQCMLINAKKKRNYDKNGKTV